MGGTLFVMALFFFGLSVGLKLGRDMDFYPPARNFTLEQHRKRALYLTLPDLEAEKRGLLNAEERQEKNHQFTCWFLRGVGTLFLLLAIMAWWK